MKKSLAIILFVGFVVGVVLWSSYNSLVTTNEAVENQWAQVEAQYQRRFDLVPNLVNSVKGAMNQEQEIFSAIAEARTRYSGAVGAEEKAGAATQLEGALGRLLVVMENYPQLKSIDTVQTLMAQLEGTENRISVERSRYNDTIKIYNLKIKTIPTKWLAGMFGFTERSYFEAVNGSETAPTVDLIQ